MSGDQYLALPLIRTRFPLGARSFPFQLAGTPNEGSQPPW